MYTSTPSAEELAAKTKTEAICKLTILVFLVEYSGFMLLPTSLGALFYIPTQI
jgi:hypothetical protein